MRVRILHEAPAPDVAAALSRFEEQFRYPLGPERTFRICHGDDYPRFFRAMGEAACFVAERDGRIVGVLGAALRTIALPSGELRRAAYLGDLKVDPSARGGWVLPRLAEAAQRWIVGKVDAAFAVVMDGTLATPPRYTGRLGIPPFEEVGRIMVLRIETCAFADETDDGPCTDAVDCEARYLRLSRGRYACPGGAPAERSSIEPQWILDPPADACARLEDTRRAKRLVGDDGAEMPSAHLSGFAYADLCAAAAIVRRGLGVAARRGIPSLFVSVPSQDGDRLIRSMSDLKSVAATATIYGAGVDRGYSWNINTAEI